MTIVRKAAAAEVDGLEFVLSDETLDSYGDVVEAAGWDLRRFKKNPIALFGHSSGFPIGKWANVRVEGKKLLGRLEFAVEGTSARIDELRRLVGQGILRAVSVGFRPIEYEPLDKNQPYGGQRYTKQELMEASLVSVPANPSALQLAKGIGISDDTMTLVFGEHAGADDGTRRRGTTGEHAAPHSGHRNKTVKTLSQRIEDAQTEVVRLRDTLVELTAADDPDADALEEANKQLDGQERVLAALKASEAKLGQRAAETPPDGIRTPAVHPRGRQKDLGGVDLLVRAMTVHGISHFGPGKKSIDQVLDERYRGHEATALVAKADQVVATTGTTGWASELVQTVYGEFMEALQPQSFFAQLRTRGRTQTFDGFGKAVFGARTGAGASGSFVGEGAPIRVGRATLTSAELTPRKMGVIVPFTRELAKRSTPSIEAEVRQWILEDTAKTLDQLSIDAVAGDSVRPAGLLNGVSATAAGAGGGDYEAVIADFKALLAPFITANAADGVVVLMNPSQGLALALMPDGEGRMSDWFGPVRQRITLIESGNVPAGRLIAIRASDLATAGDAPDFDISEQATVHMEDTTPLEIVSGTGPTTADPVRSFFQTATIGVRMLMDQSWTMLRPGMVQWINGTSW
jgi:HK97 family phage major capsid protein/HK97 family phage prohead protease